MRACITAFGPEEAVVDVGVVAVPVEENALWIGQGQFKIVGGRALWGGEMYGEVDIRRLKDVSCNHVVKTSACAGDSKVRDQIGFLLEALDCIRVIDALFWAQGAPEQRV